MYQYQWAMPPEPEPMLFQISSSVPKPLTPVLQYIDESYAVKSFIFTFEKPYILW